jgi:parallel beta-helix repeat protein
MCEISHGGTTISGNVALNNAGSQIYISNSDGITVNGNFAMVNPYKIVDKRGPATGGGIDVINNRGRGNDREGVTDAV